MTPVEIQQALRKFRIEQRVSQDALGFELGKRQNSICMMEKSSRVNITIKTLIAWAGALGYELVLQEKRK